MIKNYLEKNLYTNVNIEVRTKYPTIQVKPKKGLFNYKCYLNAIEFALNHKNYFVYEVIYIEDGKPILHYVNEKKGIFYETTLGHLAKNNEYHLVKCINQSDYKYIEFEFENSKKYWDRTYLKWYHKLFGINRAV